MIKEASTEDFTCENISNGCRAPRISDAFLCPAVQSERWNDKIIAALFAVR